MIRPALETDDKHWDWTLAANARALLSLTRAAAPSMPSGSSIVAISSLGSVASSRTTRSSARRRPRSRRSCATSRSSSRRAGSASTRSRQASSRRRARALPEQGDARDGRAQPRSAASSPRGRREARDVPLLLGRGRGPRPDRRRRRWSLLTTISLAHEALPGGRDERDRLGEEHAHRVAERGRLRVGRAFDLNAAERGGREIHRGVQGRRRELLALGVSCTDSACFSANSRSAPRRSSGSPPPNGKKPPLPSISRLRRARPGSRPRPRAGARRPSPAPPSSAAANGEAPPDRAPARGDASPRRSRPDAPASPAAGDRRSPRAAPALRPRRPRSLGASRARRSARLAISPSRSPPPAASTATSHSAAIEPAARSSGRLSRASRRCRAEPATHAVRAVDRAEVDAPPGLGLGREESRRRQRLRSAPTRAPVPPKLVAERHVATIGGVPSVDAVSCSRRSVPRTTASAQPVARPGPLGGVFSPRASHATADTCSTSRPGPVSSPPSCSGAGSASPEWIRAPRCSPAPPAIRRQRRARRGAGRVLPFDDATSTTDLHVPPRYVDDPEQRCAGSPGWCASAESWRRSSSACLPGSPGLPGSSTSHAGLPLAGRALRSGWREVGDFLGESIREYWARYPAGRASSSSGRVPASGTSRCAG